MEDNQLKRSFTVHDLPAADRPRERLKKLGAENLSAQELLSALLGQGSGESVMITAQRLLDKFNDIQGIANASVEELIKIRGIGLAKACQLKVAFELGNRWDKAARGNPKNIVKTPEEAYNVLKNRSRDQRKEHFWAILLDTRNKEIKTVEVSVGSLDTSIVHPRELFKEAIAASASSVIVAHNHPSGNPEASQDDIKLTRRLAEVGKLMGIEVVDHIIIGDGRFISLKREGMF
jgi:DNA repair protein RadC